MKRIERRGKSLGYLMGVCGLLAMMAAGQTAFSQAGLPARPSSAQEHAAKPAKPGTEGITVHGHWVIDVKNPDGSLAQHRDFQNGLINGGYFLIGMMGGNFVPSDYVVVLSPGVGSPSICSSTGCSLVESTTGLAGSNQCSLGACAAGLTQTVTLDTVHSIYTLVLAGQFTATQMGYVGNVQTVVGLCGTQGVVDSTTLPSTCVSAPPAGSGSNIFTGTSITPLLVQAGQLVQVSVTITFS